VLPQRRGQILSKLEEWLAPKLSDVPDSLRRRILDAVSGGQRGSPTGGQFAEQLRRVGEELMVEAKSAPPARDTAMTLLAADALITFACEAVAETDPAMLAELR